jgi:hypothetical protein
MKIGRTGPILPTEIDNEILRLVNNLEVHTESYEERIVDAAQKEVRFKHDRAEAYLRAEGPVAQREAEADDKTANQRLAYEVAAAVAKANKETLTTIRTSLDALRTLAANVRFQTNG